MAQVWIGVSNPPAILQHQKLTLYQTEWNWHSILLNTLCCEQRLAKNALRSELYISIVCHQPGYIFFFESECKLSILGLFQDININFWMQIWRCVHKMIINKLK